MADKFSIYQLGNDGIPFYVKKGDLPPISEVDVNFGNDRLIIRIIGTNIDEISTVEGFLIEKV